MESFKSQRDAANFTDVLSVPQLWAHLRDAELTAVRGCSHATRTLHDAAVTSARIVLRDRGPGEPAARMLEALRRISARGCRPARVTLICVHEGGSRLWSDVLALPMCACATRLDLMGPHALPSREAAAALPAMAPCVRQLTVQMFDTTTSGACDVLLGALGTRLEQLELQLCGGAVVPCEGLLALATAARGATATQQAATAAGGTERPNAVAERTSERYPRTSAAASESPSWILGSSPPVEQEPRDSSALLEQIGGAAAAAAAAAVEAATAATGPPPSAVAVVGGMPVRRGGGATGGRGLRELRVILALDKHMHIGPFRYGTQARPGGALGRSTGAGAWRRAGSCTAAGAPASQSQLQAATGRAVPPAVAAIAALAPTLRSLELAGPSVERVLDPPGRLLGLSALTALQRLRVELPAATEPYGGAAAVGGSGAGYGYGIGGGGRYGGGGGGGGAGAWDVGGGGSGGSVSDGGASCDGDGVWKLGPLLAAMPWIRDLDLGPAYRLPPEALVSLAALSQLGRLRCGSIATPSPQQYRSLAAAAATAAATASVASEGLDASLQDFARRQSSGGPGAGAGSSDMSGLRGVVPEGIQAAAQEVPHVDGAEAGTGTALLPVPPSVLQLPLPASLAVLEVSALPAVPVLAALAALPRLSDLRVTPAAPSAPAPAAAAAAAAAAVIITRLLACSLR